MNWKAVRKPFDELAQAEPGQRFQRFYQRRRARRSRSGTIVRVVGGAVLVVVGVLLSMPPLVPGFVVSLTGLALIASQSQRVARWVDAAECWLRRLWGIA